MISSDLFQIQLTHYCSQLFLLPCFPDTAIPVTREAELTVYPLVSSPGLLLSCALGVREVSFWGWLWIAASEEHKVSCEAAAVVTFTPSTRQAEVA